MQSLIERFFSSHVAGFRRDLARFERRLDADETPFNDQALAELARCITDSLDVCAQLERQLADEPELLKGVQARYREAIWPWFGKSWFIQRSFSKPRGYPGDYELLNSIYDRMPKSQGFGGYLDRYILDSTLGRAVVARLRAARQFLTREVAARGGNARILNVACGPGREYVDGFLDAEAGDVEITCVDNDTASLDFVQTNVAPQMSPQISIRFQRYNALRMISGKVNVDRFGRSDIIYSVGLCDYIPDDYLVPMLRGWRESLADGGVVYVAFKDMELYDKAVYQWLMDWYFYQRTYEDCRRLFVEAGYDMDEMEITRSDMAVIVNFIGRTKVGGMVRIDEAEPLSGAHLAEVDEPAPDSTEVESGS
jgi:extracellular factor (EF) 3-hydroxypalmitic acid methyl ester biosynthesis protein